MGGVLREFGMLAGVGFFLGGRCGCGSLAFGAEVG